MRFPTFLVAAILAIPPSGSVTPYERRTELDRFWSAPGQTVVGSDGRLVYEEFRNSRDRSEEVYDRGKWFTRRYAPDRLQIVEVRSSDTVDRYSYDTEGAETGIDSQFEGLNFGLRKNPQGSLSVTGLPLLEINREDSRLGSVNFGGSRIEFSYSDQGRLSEVRLAGGSVLSFRRLGGGRISERLTGPDARLIGERVVRNVYGPRRWHLLNLDLVARELGLGEGWTSDWIRRVAVRWNSTGSVATVTDLAGTTLLHVLRDGPISIGFDSSGVPLFYDLDLTQDLVGDEATGVIPSRIILTADGRIELQAPMSPDGAWESIWPDATDPGRGRWFLRSVGRPVKQIQYSRRPMLSQVCDESTVCSNDGSGETCSTTYYYCDFGDWGGGGCYDCYGGGDPSSGGGGAPSHGSVMISNTMLRNAVSNAVTLAEQKLQNSGCLGVFSRFQNPDGRTAQDVLNSNGTNASDWMESWVRFVDGNGNATCNSDSSNEANTSPGSRVVNVCRRFVDYQRSNPGVAADTLIHEVLHTLGLSENPPDASQPSSYQIQAAVEEQCGR